MGIINTISNLSIPLIIVSIMYYGLSKKINIFDSFLKGAKEGISISFDIIPSLIGLLAAIAVFQSSGVLDFLTELISPIAGVLNLPTEVIPLAILRPLSGSASLAFLTDLFKTYGPDSIISVIAATIMGCSETILYTVAVYLGPSKIHKTRFAIPLALLINFVGFIICSYLCQMLF